uniref:Uncharacterized protein n=1 Tax=Aegilops tauschii subsp. strangulata TaxID=200361 RepID=A0A453L9C1_AEGTS
FLDLVRGLMPAALDFCGTLFSFVCMDFWSVWWGILDAFMCDSSSFALVVDAVIAFRSFLVSSI